MNKKELYPLALFLIITLFLVITIPNTSLEATCSDCALYLKQTEIMQEDLEEGIQYHGTWMTPFIIYLFSFIFTIPIAAKISIFLAAIGCIILTYALGKELFSKEIGILAALLLSVSPWFLMNSTRVLTDTFFTFFFILFMYSSYLFIRDRRFPFILLAICSLLILMKTKDNWFLAPLSLVIYLGLITLKDIKKLNKVHIGIAIISIIFLAYLTYRFHFIDILVNFLKVDMQTFHSLYLFRLRIFQLFGLEYAYIIRDLAGIFLAFCLFRIYRNTKDKKPFNYVLAWAFTVLFGFMVWSFVHLQVRYLLPALTPILILLSILIWKGIESRNTIVRNAVIVISFIYILFLALQAQALVSDFAHVAIGFPEASKWLDENTNKDDEIRFTRGTRRFEFYSHLPQLQKGYTREKEPENKYYVIDPWEVSWWDDLDRYHNIIDKLIKEDYQVEKIIYKKVSRNIYDYDLYKPRVLELYDKLGIDLRPSYNSTGKLMEFPVFVIMKKAEQND